MSKQYIGKEKDNRQSEQSNNFFDTYIVKEGNTLYDIAKENNVDVSMLAEINGIMSYDYLYPNQKIMIPKNDVVLYITKQGDTLQDFVKKTGKNIDEIIKSNSSIYLLPEQLMIYKE